MRMRRAYGNDAERIAEINVFAWRMAYFSLVDDTFLFTNRSVSKTAARFKSRLESGESEMYVYEEEDVIKGYISISEGNQLELIAIYVEPPFWKQGIGSEMVVFFENLAQKREIADLHIWVLEDNESARAFYEKHSYQLDGATKIIESINRKACLYSKKTRLIGE